MPHLTRSGVRLWYADSAPDSVQRPAMVLVHGWCGEHSLMAAQAERFQASHRVVSVDLRGYGNSDAPQQQYSMAGYADDVAWLCEQLKLVEPLVVGHSMGGNVALELAARHPHVPQAVVLIDTLVCPAAEVAAGLEQLVAGVTGSDYMAVANGLLQSICLPSDAFRQKLHPTAALHAPQHVVLSSLRCHTTDYSAVDAASACKLPIAYIASSKSLANLAEFQRLTPQLQTATVLGIGHFCAQEQPEQVNAMIAQFIRLQNKTEQHTNGAA